MKKLEIKLNHEVKKLLFTCFPNKQALFNGYEDLKKLLNSSFLQKECVKIIKELKSNLFYQQFKLDADPEFLKALIKKVTDFKIIEALLKSREINYSQQETIVLEQRLNTLISLSLLEQDLKEATDFEEKDNLCQDEFFEVYFEDLEKLKIILSSESVSVQHIDWFFESDLFEFISGASDCFDVELVDLYKILLDETEIKTRKNFVEHKQLLEKAQKENSLDYDKFYVVLNGIKKQLTGDLKKPPTLLEHNSFYKPPKAIGLSPIARKALLNNFKKYTAPYPSKLNR